MDGTSSKPPEPLTYGFDIYPHIRDPPQDFYTRLQRVATRAGKPTAISYDQDEIIKVHAIRNLYQSRTADTRLPDMENLVHVFHIDVLKAHMDEEHRDRDLPVLGRIFEASPPGVAEAVLRYCYEFEYEELAEVYPGGEMVLHQRVFEMAAALIMSELRDLALEKWRRSSDRRYDV